VFGNAAASEAQPAGLPFGISPITANAGSATAAMAADLSGLNRCDRRRRRHRPRGIRGAPEVVQKTVEVYPLA
jgi:hypothetical protein